MENIIFFFEPSERFYETPLKIGKLYLNRLKIDENAVFEISSIYTLSSVTNIANEIQKKARESPSAMANKNKNRLFQTKKAKIWKNLN